MVSINSAYMERRKELAKKKQMAVRIEKFDGDDCVWCGRPICREDITDGFIKWNAGVHKECAEDLIENRALKEGMAYPIEDGFRMTQATSLSAKDQVERNEKRESHFNIDTNRYEYADGSPMISCNLPEHWEDLREEGLPWENGSKRTTPDGSSVMSGWGDKSTWGDPRPLG